MRQMMSLKQHNIIILQDVRLSESAVLDQNGRIKTRYRGTNQAISMTYEYDANGNVIKNRSGQSYRVFCL